MQSTFNKGDHVVYSVYGVCLIEDICLKSYNNEEPSEFYVLKPVFDRVSTFFAPVNNAATASRMRKPLTKDEIISAIRSSWNDCLEWENDRKVRMERFQSTIKQCDQKELLRLVSCIYMREKELSLSGKRLSAFDEMTLKKAEKMIENEFCFVLELPPDKIGKYIREKLDIA